MPALVLLSPALGAGKTTVAAAISRRVSVSQMSRLGDDANAAADGSLFAKLGGSGGLELIEAPGADPSTAPHTRALVVAGNATPPPDLLAFCRSAGERVAGVVLNKVPSRQRKRVLGAVEELGLKVLLALPEDRLLATPSLAEVASALQAQTLSFDSNGDRSLDGAVIASISADPGQGYFLDRAASTVIVRSDKPDLQLAALNAGAACLIVTGSVPLLGYITERTEADEIPIISTALDTCEAMTTIEALFGSGPFSGAAAKLSRLAELIQGFDASTLSGA
jgi:hypothetical protein